MTLRLSKRDLIAVPLVVRMLYQRAYGALPTEAHLAERLNGLAYSLAQTGAIMRSSLGGHFRYGGKKLHFVDERAPIVRIGVTRQCVEKAVTALRNQAASG
jgi:hypothetical protein